MGRLGSVSPRLLWLVSSKVAEAPPSERSRPLAAQLLPASSVRVPLALGGAPSVHCSPAEAVQRASADAATRRPAA